MTKKSEVRPNINHLSPPPAHLDVACSKPGVSWADESNRSPGRSHPLRSSSQSGRGKGRGAKGGRHASPVSDRNRRQVGRKRDNLPSKQRSRSPSGRQKAPGSSWDKREAKSSESFGKEGVASARNQSPERHGRNGSPWLEPVTPEKQSHGTREHSLTPGENASEDQERKDQSAKAKAAEEDKEKHPVDQKNHQTEPSNKKHESLTRVEDNDTEEEEEKDTSKTRNVKEGKKEDIDSSDLRHMLKRKIESTESGRGNSSSGKQDMDEKDEKRARRDKHEDRPRVLVRTKSRQSESTRKKHDGKPLLVTVASGENRHVMSGDVVNKRDEGKGSQRLSVHLRLGPAKTSWEEGKSGSVQGTWMQFLVWRDAMRLLPHVLGGSLTHFFCTWNLSLTQY
ncbi:hypothetical protein C7M84_015350 [Penaeus vannamei]|uniref:Uncharacterized protein n=1 Tax=Penaeus vannamei TaxID=6689 RepID=A0A3R7MP73_PENVA|nr:hypothetical protein C7M84_015350 [Penaeus vannamei]